MEGSRSLYVVLLPPPLSGLAALATRTLLFLTRKRGRNKGRRRVRFGSGLVLNVQGESGYVEQLYSGASDADSLSSSRSSLVLARLAHSSSSLATHTLWELRPPASHGPPTPRATASPPSSSRPRSSRFRTPPRQLPLSTSTRTQAAAVYHPLLRHGRLGCPGRATPAGEQEEEGYLRGGGGGARRCGGDWEGKGSGEGEWEGQGPGEAAEGIRPFFFFRQRPRGRTTERRRRCPGSGRIRTKRKRKSSGAVPRRRRGRRDGSLPASSASSTSSVRQRQRQRRRETIRPSPPWLSFPSPSRYPPRRPVAFLLLEPKTRRNPSGRFRLLLLLRRRRSRFQTNSPRSSPSSLTSSLPT